MNPRVARGLLQATQPGQSVFIQQIAYPTSPNSPLFLPWNETEQPVFLGLSPVRITRTAHSQHRR